MMNTKDLKCFEAVYEEQSISKAAKRLFITPQGLSKNIRLLENELETVLFERTKRGVIPTESGHFLYEKSEKIIRQFEEIENGIRQLENQTVLLRIGCACGVFNVLPFQLILKFIEENQNIQAEWCEYSNEEVKERIRDSRLEYGVIVGMNEDESLIQRSLVKKNMMLLVYEGHPIYHYKTVNVDMLKEEKILLMNEHFHMFHDFCSACQAKGFSPKIAAKTADATVLYKMCRERIGLAVVPEFILEDLRMDNIRAIPFEEELKWEVCGVYKKENKKYGAIHMFDEFLKENMT